MQVEWAKSRARMMRWEEEYLLVQEEMRRVIAWFEWKAAWWERQASLRQQVDSGILSGLGAYAHKQADIQRRLAEGCAGDWLPALIEFEVIPEWAGRYKAKERKTARGKGKRFTESKENNMEDLTLDEDSSDNDSEDDGEEGSGDHGQSGVTDDFDFED